MMFHEILIMEKSGIPITVRTSEELYLELGGISTDISDIADDVKKQLDEYDISMFSHDKSDVPLKNIELFLYRYFSPDIPFVDQCVVETNPVKPLYDEGKIGWSNYIGLYDGSYGN